MLDFILNHTLHAAPILLLAGLSTAIIVNRFQTLFKKYPLSQKKEFFQMIRELLAAEKTEEAIEYCKVNLEKPIAQIVYQALLRSKKDFDLVQANVERQVIEQNQKVTQYTPFLSTIANVATLLGLFGTIAGLIHSFQAVSNANAQEKSALLAQGISTAMNATMLGLGVAIPCMVFFSFFINRSNQMTHELDLAATEIMDTLLQFEVQKNEEQKSQSKNVDREMKKVA